MVDFSIPSDAAFDRVTYGIRNLPVASIISACNSHGVDYPISGDTLVRYK